MFAPYLKKNEVQRRAVSAVPAPDWTSTWNPIPHSDLLNCLGMELLKRDIEVVEQAHTLTHDGKRYFGMFSIERSSKDDDFNSIIGVRNSHDKTFGAQLVAGAGVIVCSNLSFDGEFAIGKKHIPGIRDEIPRMVEVTVNDVLQAHTKTRDKFTSYKETEIDSEHSALAVLALGRSGAIPASKLLKVWEEYVNPSYKEHAEHGYTVWRLYNAATQVMKGSLTELPRRTRILEDAMSILVREAR